MVRTMIQMPMIAARLVLPTAERHADPPAPEGPIGPPSGKTMAGELLGAAELARLIAQSPRLATAPRGDGRIVIDVPGWRAPEASMSPLRAYLRWLGHATRPWGLGFNRGDAERDIEQLVDSVSVLAATSGRPVALVGWSLGGLIAREVAREAPEQVAAVVTFGTPVIGGPTYTLTASSYGPEECARIEAIGAERDLANPIGVPVTAIFTRNDGVVSWQACIDRVSPLVEHVEVRSTHLGLGIDPDVWRAVAEALAAVD